MHSIAIFGGTFDPIHKGHLLTSLAIQSYFCFDKYYFLPCKAPLLKSPTIATQQQRIDMLNLAIKEYPQFTLDLRELNRPTASYMVDTLKNFRETNAEDAITLIIGQDAFLSLPLWHQWEQLIMLAHIMIIHRPLLTEPPIKECLKNMLLRHQTQDKEALLTNPSGFIYAFDAGSYEISSTQIRKQFKENTPYTMDLPESVRLYIEEYGLYKNNRYVHKN